MEQELTESGDDILELVRAFVEARSEGAPPPWIERVERITVGRSRENWVFDAHWPEDAGSGTAGNGASGAGAEDFGQGAPGTGRVEPLIVRRDPTGGLLETSRATEFAVLQALESTAVPAPRARWLDADGSWLGRPSLVMVRAPGQCDYFVVNGDRPLAERVALAERFCDLLATIHTVPWSEAGLGRVLTDPGPDAARHELEGWADVLHRDQLEPWPELEVALAWLRSNAPRSSGTVLVHGDFKPGNILLDDDDRPMGDRLAGDPVVALLDWELAHLGDPMEDLGWITQPLRRREHLIPGAWEEEQLFARYEESTGIRVDERSVAWWNVLASFKTAVMQVSGLRSFVEGRSDEPYRPTAAVVGSLLDAVTWGPDDGEADDGQADDAAAGTGADIEAGPDPVPARPTGYLVDQHLEGARRLLDGLATEPGLSPSAAAVVADVRRLLRQVASTWPGALPFLLDDNRRLASLLAATDVVDPGSGDPGSLDPGSGDPGSLDPGSGDPGSLNPGSGDTDVAGAHRRNVGLRVRLADVVANLPDDEAGRDALLVIATALRRRLDRDPANQRGGPPAPAPPADPSAPKGPA